MADPMPTMGVEEEFVLVDGAGRLIQEAPETLADTDDEDVDLKPELLRCQVESATDICRTAEDVRTGLDGLRERLSEAAAGRGLRLVASGTVVHPQEFAAVVGPDTRYYRMTREFGGMVFSGLTCGCHVHVAVDDLETAVQVVNHVRPWLPALLALSANSPFHEGRDSGYASSRYILWSRWPTSGPPPYLRSVEEYEAVVSGMIASTAAMDRKMVYWDARPSEQHSTVEVRVADVQGTTREATLFGVLVRSLLAGFVERIGRGEVAEPIPGEVLRGWLWRAARDGLEGRCADPATGELRPALEIVAGLVDALDERDERDFARDVLEELRRDGGGAARQRAALTRRGELDDVVELLARQTMGERAVPIA